HTLCQQARRERGSTWLSGDETRQVLSAFNLPLPPGGICHDENEAAAMARQIGFPVALKLASHTVVHKTEMGGVRLNLSDQTAVCQAFREIQTRLARDNKLQEMDGVLVKQMISGDCEDM